RGRRREGQRWYCRLWVLRLGLFVCHRCCSRVEKVSGSRRYMAPRPLRQWLCDGRLLSRPRRQGLV
ncbi:hypothetical protein LTR87_018060, partial [Friedmanniomyces endolithicus]